MKKFWKSIIFLGLLLTMVSCSTMHTIISKRNLDVQTKMSDTIWLEPAAASQKTVFVKISNTTGKDLNIEQKIISVLSAKGYRVVGELTNTDRIMNDTFWVGLYPGMSNDMLDFMAKMIIEGVRE